uniref:helix-turn-helix domain-containing transcriptional regulator n=2 Tax=Gammaproteobacteria TaxID=1236 RepID=UPI00370379C3
MTKLVFVAVRRWPSRTVLFFCVMADSARQYLPEIQMKRPALKEWDVVDHLDSKEEILLYLEEVFNEDDLAFALKALDDAKRALEKLYGNVQS